MDNIVLFQAITFSVEDGVDIDIVQAESYYLKDGTQAKLWEEQSKQGC